MEKSKSLKIIPETRPAAPGWVNPLIGFFIILLAVVLGIFYFLNRETSALDKNINDLEIELAGLRTNSVNQLEKEIMALSEKITDFTGLINQRKELSSFIEFFQEICHPRVQFINFNFSVKDSALSLAGVAQNFRVLGEQLLILRQEARVEEFELTQTRFNDEGVVEFYVSILLAESFFE